ASGTLILFAISLVAGKKYRHLPDYILISWLLLFLVDVLSFIMISRGISSVSTWGNVLLGFSEASLFLHGLFFGSMPLHLHDLCSRLNEGIYFISCLFFFVLFIFYTLSISTRNHRKEPGSG